MKRIYLTWLALIGRNFSADIKSDIKRTADPYIITIKDKTYRKDEFTNVSPRILSYIGKNLHNREYHPICLVKQRVSNFFNNRFKGRSGNPIFSVYDNINPVVTVKENFDSLLVPEDHASRNKTDCYYLNQEYVLRSHTTAHQAELILMGLDNFIIFGDVYRRDDIDQTHYPVFHQADGVYSLNEDQVKALSGTDIKLFNSAKGDDTDELQGEYTVEAMKFMENHLKSTLVSLALDLFGEESSYKWVPAYFPFTHPSWELELMLNNKWTEILGCGIVRHKILQNSGAGNRIAWAFGLGLERYAMLKYVIPDIRIFWSQDPGFLTQFHNVDPYKPILYKPVSVHPPCYIDISFWLPTDRPYHRQDFYEVVRNVGGDFVEQVNLIDEYRNPTTGLTSHCYRITYRHMERTLTKEEVNALHKRVSAAAASLLHIKIR